VFVGQPHLHSPLLPPTGCAPHWAPHMQLCCCLPCTDANTRCCPCCVQAAIAVAASIGLASAAAAAAAAVGTEVPCTGTNPFLKAEGWPCCGPMPLLLLLPCSSLPSSVLLWPGTVTSPSPDAQGWPCCGPACSCTPTAICHCVSSALATCCRPGEFLQQSRLCTPSVLAAGRVDSCNSACYLPTPSVLAAGRVGSCNSVRCLHPLITGCRQVSTCSRACCPSVYSWAADQATHCMPSLLDQQHNAIGCNNCYVRYQRTHSFATSGLPCQQTNPLHC
jgi:hypothetical protein